MNAHSIRNIFRGMLNRIFAGLARKEDLDRLYDQLAGLAQIQSAMRGEPVIKSLRGWAISPDAMALILADLQERRSPIVVEFGSGQSTVIIASFLKNRGGGRLISVDHDADYADVIKRQLVACALDHIVEFHILGLEKSQPLEEQPACLSYGVDRLPQVMADLVLVDGPPMVPPLDNGKLTRFVPLKWAMDHLAVGGSVYVDDSLRPPLQEQMKVIQCQDSSVSCVDLKAEKGLSRLTRPGRARS